MTTGATLFSGFDGVGIGMKAAGIHHLWGIELQDDIAQVARNNGFNVLTGDILKADPLCFDPPDVLHASPPCPNFSVAKAGGKETDLDIALARKVAEFIAVLKPRIFTLENVFGYRKSRSWLIIENALFANGYWLHAEHVNMADFGVPQTRKRLIVRAVRGGWVPALPPPERWVGWYEAIEDLIPSLPVSKFSPWQIERLPENLIGGLLVGNQGDDASARTVRKPSFTIVSTQKSNSAYRAFITDGMKHTIRDATVRSPSEPMFTVIADAMHRPITTPKAFIVDGNNGNNFDGIGSLTIRQSDEPANTVKSSSHAVHRAWLSHGRVVSMTPRALARFQTFQDWYELPDNRALACKGIGNASPPLFNEKVYRGLV